MPNWDSGYCGCDGGDYCDICSPPSAIEIARRKAYEIELELRRQKEIAEIERIKRYKSKFHGMWNFVNKPPKREHQLTEELRNSLDKRDCLKAQLADTQKKIDELQSELKRRNKPV